MHQADSIFGHVLGFQGSDEKLVVCFVDGVAALEGQDINFLRQRLPDLLWGGTVEDPLGKLQEPDFATYTNALFLASRLKTSVEGEREPAYRPFHE